MTGTGGARGTSAAVRTKNSVCRGRERSRIACTKPTHAVGSAAVCSREQQQRCLSRNVFQRPNRPRQHHYHAHYPAAPAPDRRCPALPTPPSLAKVRHHALPPLARQTRHRAPPLLAARPPSTRRNKMPPPPPHIQPRRLLLPTPSKLSGAWGQRLPRRSRAALSRRQRQQLRGRFIAAAASPPRMVAQSLPPAPSGASAADTAGTGAAASAAGAAAAVAAAGGETTSSRGVRAVPPRA